MNTTDKNNASFAYSVGLLKMLLEMQLITKEEYKKIVRISAAHYDAEKICVCKANSADSRWTVPNSRGSVCVAKRQTTQQG